MMAVILDTDTVAISAEEGSDWELFVPHTRPPDRRGNRVHAILFADGRVWDASNGWRPQNTYQRNDSDALVRHFRPQPIDATDWAEAAFEQPHEHHNRWTTVRPRVDLNGLERHMWGLA